MFDNIGGKIKGWAKITCLIGIIGSCIGGFYLMTLDEGFVLFGLLIIVIGVISSWVGSFVLYGYGELISKVARIENKLCGAEAEIEPEEAPEAEVVETPPIERSYGKDGTPLCPKCGSRIKAEDECCPLCRQRFI